VNGVLDAPEGIKIMSSEPNSTEQSRASYSEWATKVVENLVEAEKKWIEFASQQNALVLKAIRDGIELYRQAPNPVMGGWAKQGLESFMEAQKKWTENVTQQREQFFQSQEQGTDDASEAKVVTGYAQQQVESLIEARKKWLDFASQQNTQFLNAVKQGLGITDASAAKNLTDWAQQSMDSYVEIQKRWLDLYVNLPFQPFGRTR
jgi:hypothetical protein